MHVLLDKTINTIKETQNYLTQISIFGSKMTCLVFYFCLRLRVNIFLGLLVLVCRLMHLFPDTKTTSTSLRRQPKEKERVVKTFMKRNKKITAWKSWGLSLLWVKSMVHDPAPSLVHRLSLNRATADRFIIVI